MSFGSNRYIFTALVDSNGDSHRYKGSNIGIKKIPRIVLSAEVFLNLGGTTDICSPWAFGSGRFFLSALDNLYIQEESVMEKKYDFQKAEKALEKMWQENEIYRYQNGKERKNLFN